VTEADQPRSYSAQAGILLLGRVLATSFEFLSPLIIVRLLGKAEVGVLSALLLVYSTVAMVVTAGMPDTLMYYLPKRPRGERRIIAWKVATSLFLLGGVASVVFVAMAALTWLVPDSMPGFLGGGDENSLIDPAQTAGLLLLLALYPLADLPGRMLTNLLVVEGRARAAAGVGVIKAIGGTVVFVIPLAMGADLSFVIAAVIAWAWVMAAVLVGFLRSVFGPRQAGAETEVSYRGLFRFGIPLGVTDIVAMLNGNVDKYLILLAFPAAVFAEYHAGAWQVPLITSIAYTVGTAYTPRFAELFKDGLSKQAIEIWRETVIKVSLLVAPLAMVFIVAAEETMELLFTADYLRGSNVFRLYAMLMLGRVAAFGAVIVAAGRPEFVLQAALLSLVGNIALSAPLTWLIGFEGPALGTLLAFIPTVIFYCWCIARAGDLRLREIFPLVGWLKVVVTAAVAAVPAVAFKLHVDWSPGLKLGLIAVIVVGTYSVMGTLTRQISRADWQYVGDWFRLKILKD
jgi:O-antigen/teichoic acid export membrane protein